MLSPCGTRYAWGSPAARHLILSAYKLAMDVQTKPGRTCAYFVCQAALCQVRHATVCNPWLELPGHGLLLPSEDECGMEHWQLQDLEVGPSCNKAILLAGSFLAVESGVPAAQAPQS